MNRITATEDLTSVEWRDMNWLERVGGFHNQQMVLDYFALSPFWDRQCNNQVLSMQTQYNDMRQPYEATVEALRKMTGIEFAVVHEQPPVWIIQKRYRRSPQPDDVNPIATYYIMGANVYQSPTIYSVIANRLLTSLFHVNSAFKETQDMMEFYPSKGYTWKQAPNTSSLVKQPSTPTSATGEKGNNNGAIIVNTAKGILRAQETQAFRHWMDRAIETSSMKVMQTRQAIDTPELNDSTLKPSASGLDLSSATSSQQTNGGNGNNREEVGGKRPRKKIDEGGGSRKKKATK